MLVEFTGTPEYAKYLERYAKGFAEIFSGPGTVIYYGERDEKYKAQIQQAFGQECTMQVDQKIQIGGIRAENEAMHLAADNTLDSVLEDQRGWFEEKFGNGCGLSRIIPICFIGDEFDGKSEYY